jgi:hypothetical protein
MVTRRFSTLVAILFLLACSGATVRAQMLAGQPREDSPLMSVTSPFVHLVDAYMAPRNAPVAKQSMMPWICPAVSFYDPAGSDVGFNQSLPTSQLAILWSAPVNPVLAPCTVWTVHVDFELVNSSTTDKDTIQFFVREGAYPYTQLYTTYFIARSGDNFGEYEIDPPAVPPYNSRAIINQKRALYVGYYVKGNAAHSVNWRFKGPSTYSNPTRSVAFSSPTSITDVSNVVGQSVDWNAVVRVCCKYPIPVELSLFNASLNGNTVALTWRTESEINNYAFEVQRGLSSSGPWTTRDTVPGNGTTQGAKWYSYSDQAPSASELPANADAVWYRLRQLDYDGTVNELHPVRVALGRVRAAESALLDVFPNPLQTGSMSPVVIRYQLAEEQSVRISVVDALGREVAVPVQRSQAAGQYETAWYPGTSAQSLRGGVYFVRMQAGASMDTRKIVIQ